MRVAKERIQVNQEQGKDLGLGRKCVPYFLNKIIFSKDAYNMLHTCAIYEWFLRCNVIESRKFSGKISGHWILAPGSPASRTPVATPMSHKACCPVEEWHVPSSLASEVDQA